MLAWLNENGAAVSTLMAIATAIVAVLALRQTARDSADRSRPMVLAEFRRAVNSDRTVDLVIRNAGASMARDVHVTFDGSWDIWWGSRGEAAVESPIVV